MKHMDWFSATAVRVTNMTLSNIVQTLQPMKPNFWRNSNLRNELLTRPPATRSCYLIVQIFTVHWHFPSVCLLMLFRKRQNEFCCILKYLLSSHEGFWYGVLSLLKTFMKYVVSEQPFNVICPYLIVGCILPTRYPRHHHVIEILYTL